MTKLPVSVGPKSTEKGGREEANLVSGGACAEKRGPQSGADNTPDKQTHETNQTYQGLPLSTSKLITMEALPDVFSSFNIGYKTPQSSISDTLGQKNSASKIDIDTFNFNAQPSYQSKSSRPVQSPGSMDTSNTSRSIDHVHNFKPLWSSPVLPHPLSPVSTRLEELLHDCFTASINKSLLSSEKAAIVQKFHKFLYELHCHENLAFIIEIYKYEYFYEKIHGSDVQNLATQKFQHLNSSFLNQLLENHIESLPFPTKSMRKSVRRNLLRSRSSQSLNNIDPFPLDFDEPVETNNMWENFCDQNISSDSEDEWDQEGDASSPLSNSDPSDPSGCLERSESSNSFLSNLLAEQWIFIMTNFVEPNSPSQINLCDRTIDLIRRNMLEDSAPNPLVLARARSEVVIILRENAFDSFIRKENIEENNIFNRLYASSLPTLGMDSTFEIVNVQSKEPKNYAQTITEKARVASPRSGEVLSAMNGSVHTANVVAPMPSKRRTKFFSAFSNNSSSEGLSSPSGSATGLFNQLKSPALNGHNRVASAVPESPSPSSARSRAVTPSLFVGVGESISRPDSSTSDGQQSPSILGKLWRKKK